MSSTLRNIFKVTSRLVSLSKNTIKPNEFMSLYAMKKSSLFNTAEKSFFSSSKKAKEDGKEQKETENEEKEKNKKDEKKEEPKQKTEKETKKDENGKECSKNVLEKLLEQERTKEVEAKIKALFQQKENELKEKDTQAAKLEKRIKSYDEQAEDMKKKINELRQNLTAQVEEVELTKKRYEKEKNSIKDFAITKFAKDLLDIIDNLERAIENEKSTNPNSDSTLLQGVSMTLSIFEKVLLNHSVKKFSPLGEKFNPNLHEALFQIPQEKEESGIIGNIAQIGYMISDRVLRPAKVGVFKKIATEKTEEKKNE